MIDKEWAALQRKVAANPENLALRAELYRALLRTGHVKAKALEFAAFHGDPAAKTLLEDAPKEGLKTDEDLESLRALPLDVLEFEGFYELTERAFELIKEFPLSTLSFYRCYWVTDRYLEHLSGMSLRHLTLSWSFVTDIGLASLCHLPLETLHLSFCPKISAAGLEHWVRPSWTSLSLRACDNIFELPSTLNLAPLKRLDLRGARCLTPEGLASMKHLPLESLDISYCQGLGDEDLVHLKGMPLIDLSIGGKIGPPGFSKLAGLPLQRLEIVSGSLSDENFEIFSAMPLESLSLRETSLITVSPAAVQRLRQAPLKQLRLVDCEMNTGQVASFKGLPLTELSLQEYLWSDDDLEVLEDVRSA